MDKLIERLEGATEGGGGLDGLVWEAVGRCAHRETKYYAVQSDTGFKCVACGVDMYGVKIPKLTTSVDAALALMEEKLPGFRWGKSILEDEIAIYDRRTECVWHGRHALAPIAILVALLKSLSVKRREPVEAE